MAFEVWGLGEFFFFRPLQVLFVAACLAERAPSKKGPQIGAAISPSRPVRVRHTHKQVPTAAFDESEMAHLGTGAACICKSRSVDSAGLGKVYTY